ncbi:MAG: DNA repair protein RecO [Oscillospiraceae bacterium]|jgi:DNA repair protein RecO (recombination protein O)|nr:DNA repair protein RecO [Oscillospiraceae bacterium]
MAHLVTKALVLREVNYKESDKILTVLAQGQGKRTVKAQGCRRKNSPLAAAGQLLVFSDMTLYDYQDRWALKEAATAEEFRGLRGDLEKLALGTYFAEVCEAVSQDGVETPGLLSLILNSLYALDKLDKPPKVVKAAFELRLCCLAGYEPLVDGCAVCGEENPDRPRLNLSEGVLHCEKCRRELGDGGISMPLDGPSLTALRYIAYGDPKRLFSFQIPEKSLDLLAGAAEGFLLTQLERGFRTLDFYKGLM